MNGNSFIQFLLRSPLHGVMSGSTMLITIKGRKTGRLITLPVNYVRDGNLLWVVSYRSRTWWRNISGGVPVKILLRGQEKEALADAILDEAKVAEALGSYVQKFPISARAIGVRLENGLPNREDLSQAAQERVMIRIEVKSF